LALETGNNIVPSDFREVPYNVKDNGK